METDRNFTLRIRDRERKLISKIREAMDRIEDGTYGYCEICGGEIGEKRLKARPVTTMCIACKSSQEEEGAPGGNKRSGRRPAENLRNKRLMSQKDRQEIVMPEEVAEIVSWTAEALRGILNII